MPRRSLKRPRKTPAAGKPNDPIHAARLERRRASRLIERMRETLSKITEQRAEEQDRRAGGGSIHKTRNADEARRGSRPALRASVGGGTEVVAAGGAEARAGPEAVDQRPHAAGGGK